MRKENPGEEMTVDLQGDRAHVILKVEILKGT